jgi:hypothetical protein
MDDRFQQQPDYLNVTDGEAVEPFIEVVNRLHNAPRPTLNAATKARLESKIFDVKVVSFKRDSMRRLMFRAVAAVLIAVIFVSGGTAWASEDALPGETLYPVKRFVEDTRLTLATSQNAEIELRTEFAQRRLDEFKQLLAKGDVNLDIMQDVNHEIGQLQRLSSSDASRLDLISLTQAQQSLLTEAQQIRPQNNTISMLTTDVEARLTGLRLPDLSVCDFEYWTAQPDLWSDVAITINGKSFEQATILAMETNGLLEQVISVQLNTSVYNAEPLEYLPAAEDTLAGVSTEFSTDDLTERLAVQCNEQIESSQESSANTADNVGSAADDGPVDDNGGSNTTNPPASTEIDCSHPPPPHAPANGWRERCGEPGPAPGVNGQGNQNSNSDNNGNRGNGRGNNKDQ